MPSFSVLEVGTGLAAIRSLTVSRQVGRPPAKLNQHGAICDNEGEPGWRNWQTLGT